MVDTILTAIGAIALWAVFGVLLIAVSNAFGARYSEDNVDSIVGATLMIYCVASAFAAGVYLF